jgi:hypothetical protein
MNGGASVPIGNAVRLGRWAPAGTGGDCRIAAKMLRSGLRTRDPGGRRLSPAGLMTPRHLAERLAQKCQHSILVTKATPKSP